MGTNLRVLSERPITICAIVKTYAWGLESGPSMTSLGDKDK